MSDQMIVSIVFLSIGLLMIFIGLCILFFGVGLKKLKCTEETIGTVVDKVRGSNSTLYPVIEYEVAGTLYRRKKNVVVKGSINNGYPFGYELKVLYDPNKPGRCLIGGVAAQVIVTLIPAFIGLIFAAIGGVILLFN